MAPAFGAYTTTADLGRVVRFLLGYSENRLLGRDYRQLLLEPSADGRSLGLGIGRFQGRPVARHGGWFAAHRSYVLIDLNDGIGVAVIANSDNARPGVIAETLLAAVLQVTETAD
jgi:CubicO group peptidase (beta-lactamase class C family)